MKNVLIFVLGAATGSVITWKLVEQKYKKIADEEIASVKERFKNRDKEEKEEEKSELDTTEENDTDIEIKKYKDIAINYTVDDYAVEVVEEDFSTVAPFVISPDEFGEKIGYETKSWTYYADNVLADEDDQIVGDYETIIGDGLKHFGDFDDDSVYIRNDNEECDYEILRHNRTYNEVNGIGY